MNKILKSFGLVILVFIAISAIFALVNPQALQKNKELALSELVKNINNNQVEKITISGSELAISFKNGEKSVSRKEVGSSLDQSLKNYGVSPENLSQVEIQVNPEKNGVLDWLMPFSFILPLIVFGLFFWMILRQAKGGASQTFSFLRSPAKLFDSNNKTAEKITFKDVAGLQEAKEEVAEIVEFLKVPQRFLDMGAKIPKGVLLIGPPGCGKTLLARAVANEAGVPFYSMSGSEFIELFVGVGASRARSLFETAKKNAPSIVFIDEIDSIGKVRGVGMGGGHDEREQTLNQILAEMDGFEKNTQVIVMAATNRPEYLDPALLRPGRFDRRIILDEPDVKGREEVLKIHSREKPLASGTALREVAERTPGFSGADLANLMNEAAILATRRNKKQIEQTDILESIEKVLLGPERKSHLLSQKEKKVSAFHEAGHALVSSLLPEAEEVRKISIVSRGMAAGYTLALPKEEKRIRTKSEFQAELAVLLAGYTAEQLQFKEISTGASNDLEKASQLARKMVTKYGMSKLGPISFGKRETLEFIGYEQETERNYSDKVAALIDQETEKFIKEAQQTAVKVLKQKKKLLNKVANVLVTKETIEKEEFEKLIGIKKK
ncbi:MAG: ATP-dependent zinc metalloprotease FtsH [Candidatus Pacebacteria bacterium]|nr:ATP-dependent zinc metalloprotease FtsH [Candidatus Paceibacterota bacterium]